VVWTPYRIEQWRRTGERLPVAVWTAAQTAQFLHAIEDHRLYAAYHLIALRGLRRGEAAGLRWCDLDHVAVPDAERPPLDDRQLCGLTMMRWPLAAA
jgi:integrase